MSRFWTAEQARGELAAVRHALETLRSRVVAGAHVPPSDEAVRHALQLLEDDDIVLRDPATGIIDFRAKDDEGTEYYLCYRLGEPDLGFWHGTDEGFASRRPLPAPGGGAGPER